ncbi:hypothetical protein JI435_429570 [Parastagonospora nodorum SN15]|uniref:Uncharacterized protein n=1 Tax=Phaeosphaeria nodorum (strain SN15 / ATCC MYA-4574 / FGSC 10173) TaxID=321614 RepID=A0A7U2HX20_PHANO|nr:hypothetical protein JI435_429570 [Parastagonospora nodorum SN15]
MDMEEEEELDKFTYILFDPNVYLAELSVGFRTQSFTRQGTVKLMMGCGIE